MAVDINITPIIREVTIEIGQGGGDAVWGDIIGTLSNQTDLALQQTAQDDLISTNATDIGTNVTGILALDTDVTNLETSQGIQDTAIALNTAKVTFPEAPNDGTQYARKNLGWEAVAGGGASSIITAYKTADESKVNDNTQVLDTDLQMELEANSVYNIQASWIVSGDSTSDFRWLFEVPTGASGNYADGVQTSAGSAGIITFATAKTLQVTNSNRYGSIVGVIMTTDAGTFGLKWSQGNLNVASTTLYKGSNIILTKLN